MPGTVNFVLFYRCRERRHSDNVILLIGTKSIGRRSIVGASLSVINDVSDCIIPTAVSATVDHLQHSKNRCAKFSTDKCAVSMSPVLAHLHMCQNIECAKFRCVSGLMCCFVVLLTKCAVLYYYNYRNQN